MLSSSASSARLLQRLATTSLKSRVLAAQTFRLAPTSSAFAARRSTAAVIRSFSSSRTLLQTPLEATSDPTGSEEIVKADSPEVADPLAPETATATLTSTSESVAEEEGEAAIGAERTNSTQAEAEVAADQSPVDPLESGAGAGEAEGIKDVFVGGLSWNVDNEWLEAEIYKALEIEEGVESLRIARNPGGKSKGFAFVTFTTPELAARAATLELPIDNRVVQFRIAEPRPEGSARTPRPERAQGERRPRNPPTNTLWLGNLAYTVDESALGEIFSEFGTVVRTSIPIDRETSYARGIGYVEFESVEVAQKAMQSIDEQGGMELERRQVRLDFSQSVSRPTFGSRERSDRGRGGRDGGRDGGRGFGGDRRGGDRRGGGGGGDRRGGGAGPRGRPAPREDW